MNASTRLLNLWLVLALLGSLVLVPSAPAQDSKLKSWTTAELLGAMRWARAQSEDRRERLEYAAAELICRRRLEKQIDAGVITHASMLIISENVRKRGVYRGDRLTLARADELRRLIIGGRFLESLKD